MVKLAFTVFSPLLTYMVNITRQSANFLTATPFQNFFLKTPTPSSVMMNAKQISENGPRGPSQSKIMRLILETVQNVSFILFFV